MRTISLRETDLPTLVDLTDEEAAALTASELVVVAKAPGADQWELTVGRKVGVARTGNIEVVVRPKISMDRLIFLMGYAQAPDFWRDSPVLLDPEADLAEALADSFVRQAGKAIEQGLLHGYVPVEEALATVRGRIRIGDQIRQRPGQWLPLEVAYDEYAVDIAENQLMLAAADRLLRIASVPRRLRQGLLGLRMTLADVRLLRRGEPLPRWQASRLNTRYQPALHLAELILSGHSFEQRVGALSVSGFVFDMWRIYEDFVCVALKEAFALHGGRSTLQRRAHLDEGRAVALRPDFWWDHPDGRRTVVDAKYKAEKYGGFPNADLYQLLAYCTVFGLRDGHLIYAAGNEDPTVHAVVGADVRIHCHTLDLGTSPAVLLGRVADLAALVAQRSGSFSDALREL